MAGAGLTYRGKGTTSGPGPYSKVQVVENELTIDVGGTPTLIKVDAQCEVAVDRAGKFAKSAATAANHVGSKSITTTASKILDAVAALVERKRLMIGLKSGADVYLFFGAGTGKTAIQSYGPFSSGGTWEISGDDVWQGEVWAVCESGTAVVLPLEFTGTYQA